MSKEVNGGEAFGALLRSHRGVAGLTQEELAGLAGLSVRAVGNWERGRMRPYRRSVALLADALALSNEQRELFAQAARTDRAAGNAATPQSAIAEFGTGSQPTQEIPLQLPAAPWHFLGRTAELNQLNMWLGAPGSASLVMIAAIAGTAGVGKTALAVHWAHLLATRFSDGQLYVNLQGFGPAGRPTAPGEALRGFLDAFHVPAAQIPSNSAGRASLYRSHMARRRMLILLDNACDEAQVRPLLPAAPGCLVIVTSRNQLAGLAAIEGVRHLTLDVLSERAARDLLTVRLSAQGAAAEPKAVTELARLCAGLPVALSIVAARAATRPRFELAPLAAELRDTSDRLDALDAGEVTANIRAVFSWSDQRLSAVAARMFRLLGLHPGPDITVAAAASLAGLTRGQCRAVLAELTRAHLVTEPALGRFAFHDLLRVYAVELGRALPDEVQHEAIHRMLDHYLHTATAASMLLDQIDPPGSPRPAVPGTEPEKLAGLREAIAWFEAERLVLNAVIAQAVERHFDMHAWQLPQAIREYYIRCEYSHDLASAQRIALTAACRMGDRAAQATSHRYLGAALGRLGQHQEASTHLAVGLQLYRSLGDQPGEARC